jgi:hypothetical protein
VRDGSKKTGGIFGSPEARAPKRMLRKGVEPLTLSLLDSCATNCANRARGRHQTKTSNRPARTHRPPLPSSPVLPSLDECGGQLTVAGESCTVSSWRWRAAGHRLGSGQSTPSVVPPCSREQRTSSSQMEDDQQRAVATWASLRASRRPSWPPISRSLPLFVLRRGTSAARLDRSLRSLTRVL